MADIPQAPHRRKRTGDMSQKSFESRRVVAGLAVGGEVAPKVQLYHMLDGIIDMFISVELSVLWRRHLVYGKRNGKELLSLFTSRYASLTTMTTLLIGTEVAILFSPADPSHVVRTALLEKDIYTIRFWAGFTLFINISISIAALFAILTAWSLNTVIGEKNAHILLRSALWLHISSLPAKLALTNIFLFVVTMSLFLFVIAAWEVALPVVVVFFIGFLYLVSIYSAAGRILLYSGGIGEERIIQRDLEYELTPEELNQVLLAKAYLGKKANIHPREQYRIDYQKQLEVLQEGGPLRLAELRRPASYYLGADYADIMEDPMDEERGQDFGVEESKDA